MSRITPGDWTLLGPTLTADGVNFAVFSPRAERVEVCLFQDGREVERLALPAYSHGVHSGFVPGLCMGAEYGLRAYGPWEPSRGLLFNPNKLLLDPYAPRVIGDVRWDDAVLGYAQGQRGAASLTDSAPFVPRAAVVDHRFDWQGDRPPRTPWRETVIYEAHVKGMTATHPDVPPELRGTYAGLAHPAVIDHLLALGVTAVELLPVHSRVSERELVERGLSNYWGYGTLGFFAPDARFASAPGREVEEFKEMVRALHAAGLEVLLDVVYNHTIEGNQTGPHLSLRGLGNEVWYRLDVENDARPVDWTGCGNTLDLSQDPGLRLVLDSLRSWVRDYHVDGFRFDLASALFRGRNGVFNPGGRFSAALLQDPVLSGTKLIAEPWDLGPGGYHLGDFPRPFREWNDRFRDVARRFWRGDAGQVAELASRLGGSSDRFHGGQGVHPGPRGPLASINYVACHDGFTLADLTMYERKRNLANGEENRDGNDQNWSRSWGPEGPSDDPEVCDLRARVARSLLGTVALSLGVPMLGHGDEIGRTQQGNNNAYCQDNEVSWLDWAGADEDLVGFVAHLFKVRASLPTLARERFLDRSVARWLRADGDEMRGEDWLDAERRVLGLELFQGAGEGTALLLLNGGGEEVKVQLPPGAWTLIIDSSRPRIRREPVAADSLLLPPRTLRLLRTSQGCSTEQRSTG